MKILPKLRHLPLRGAAFPVTVKPEEIHGFITGHQFRKLVSVKLQELFPGLIILFPARRRTVNILQAVFSFHPLRINAPVPGIRPVNQGKIDACFQPRLTHGVHIFPDQIPSRRCFLYYAQVTVPCIKKRHPVMVLGGHDHILRARFFKQLRPCGGIIF